MVSTLPAGPLRIPAPTGPDGKIQILRDYINAVYAPPMTGIAVVQDGLLVATAGIGGANGQTMFWIASTSKLVTAVGAIVLIEEGLLDSSSAVTSYVPGYTENSGRQDQILLKHLLQNRSGLPQDGGCAGFACRQDRPGDATTVQYNLMTPDRGATLGNVFTPSRLTQVPYSVFNQTSFPPGSDYRYAGWGWMLAGRAMELASGDSFDILMQNRVLDRASMCRATYDGSLVDANAALGTGSDPIDGFCPEPMLAPGHRGEGEPYYHDELDCAARMPQGGLHASAHDMGMLAESVLQDLRGAGRIAGAGTMRLLFCPDGGTGIPGAPGSTCLGRAPVTGPHARLYGTDYGFGNFRQTYDYAGTTYDIYNHGGARAGFSSYFAVVPEADLAISVVTNRGGADAWKDVAECAIRVYLHGATSCWPDGSAAIANLKVTKRLADVALSWTGQVNAPSYNVPYVRRGLDIDAARLGNPAAAGVTRCSAPSPAATPGCIDADALGRELGTPYYYQVRVWCGGVTEGP